MDKQVVDVAIVGAASAGSYFARKLAEQGLKVLVIEKLTPETIGRKYDIFHVPEDSFARHGLPCPQEGDADYGFAFQDTVAHSPSLKWARCSENRVVGLHMHPYFLRLNRWAQEAGAVIEYGASFCSLCFDDSRDVSGLVYEKNGRQFYVETKLVADCSGIPAVARRSLPGDCVVENFALAPECMYHVILRYVVYDEPKEARVVSCNWRHYGVWEAPSGNPRGAILGVASKVSFEKAQAVFDRFDRCVPMPAYHVEREERGRTPYCRFPYSMVCGGFAALGDAACVNRINGEGITFSMVLTDILLDVALPYLKAGKRPSTQELWPVNKQYQQAQGAAFAAQKALMLARPTWDTCEDEFVYLTDVFRYGPQIGLSEKGLPLGLTEEQVCQIRSRALEEGKLDPQKVEQQLTATWVADAVLRHYLSYPNQVEDFVAWKETARKLWSYCPGAGHHTASL